MMTDNNENFKAEPTPVQNVIALNQSKRADASFRSATPSSAESTPVAQAGGEPHNSDDESALPGDIVPQDNWDSDKTEILTGFEESKAAKAWLVDGEGNVHEMNNFPFVIGRSEACDLIPNGRGISRRHIEISLQSGRFVVSDLDSLNGLKVNNYQVTRVILEDNDAISIGNCSLTFRYREPKEDNIELEPEKDGLAFFFSKLGMGGSAKSNVRFNLKTAGMALAALLVGIVMIQSFQSTPPGSVAMAPLAPATVTPANPATNDSTANAQKAVAVRQTQTQQTSRPPIASSGKRDDADRFAAGTVQRSVAADSIEQYPQGLQPIVTEAPKEKVVKPKEVDAATKRKLAAEKQRRLAVNQAEKEALKKLNQADDLYMQGNAQLVINELSDLTKSSLLPKGVKAKVSSKLKTIKSLYDQYSKGLVAFNSDDKETAFTEWTNFLNQEKKVYRQERSIYSTDVSSKAVNEYLAQAKAAQAAGNHQKAYELWQNAVKMNGSTEAKLSLAAVDSKVRSLYRKGLKYEYVNSDKAKLLWSEILTLVPNNNEYYTKANSKLSWYKRWGVE